MKPYTQVLIKNVKDHIYSARYSKDELHGDYPSNRYNGFGQIIKDYGDGFYLVQVYKSTTNSFSYNNIRLVYRSTNLAPTTSPFEIDHIVKVTHKLKPKEAGPTWVEGMNDSVGKKYKIVRTNNSRCKLENGFWYAISCLAKVFIEPAHQPDFRIGDKVTIFRGPYSGEFFPDYSNAWSVNMNSYIGETCTIRNITKTGVYFESNSYGFPKQVLKHPKPITSDREKSNNNTIKQNNNGKTIKFRKNLLSIRKGDKPGGNAIRFISSPTSIRVRCLRN